MKLKVNEAKYKELLTQVRDYFKASENTVHKARNEIKVISYQDASLVVKSFKIPHFINKIVYTFFRDSKAKKSYVNSLKIINFVPKPIGYIEFTKFGLLYDSYFVSEKFDYDFTIREPLIEDNFSNKEEVFKAFAGFTFNLHKNGILHKDYSPGNILIKKDEGNYIFKVVDINRMEFKSLSLDKRLENFSKLWAKDKDLEIIIKAYALLIKEDEHDCIKVALQYSQRHKDKKNFKKRLKGQKIVD